MDGGKEKTLLCSLSSASHYMDDAGKEKTIHPLLPIGSAVSRFSKKRGMLRQFEEFIAKRANRGVELIDLVKEFDKSVAKTGVDDGGVVSKEEAEETTFSPSSPLELLTLAILEGICQPLTVADLLQLSQVSKYCLHIFSNDEFWKRKAEERGVVKAIETRSWKWNLWACAQRLLFIRKAVSHEPVYLNGDVTFIDPAKIFFTRDEARTRELLDLMLPYVGTDSGCVVTYRGIPVVFATSENWDSDTAFEITRKGISCGVDTVPSKVIAVIPKRLMDMLIHENGKAPEPGSGVFVEGVIGEFQSSGDGDFMIPDPTFIQPLLHEPTLEDEVERATIICGTGGKWTMCDESSDDEEEDSV